MPATKPRPPWAIALRERRLRLGLTQDEVAARTFSPTEGRELVAQTSVSDIERGIVNPMTLRGDRLLAYYRALEMTPEEWEKLGFPRLDASEASPRDNAIPMDWEYMPYWGSGAAGYADDADAYIPVPPEHNKPGRVAMIVDGLSMYPTLADGELVYVDTTQTKPRHNKVFALRIAGNGIQFRRCIDAGSHYLFVPDNREKKYPIIGPDIEFEIVGQVTEKPTLTPVE